MIEGMLVDNVDILSQLQKDVTWIEYNDRINLHEFEKVHVSASADFYTLMSTIYIETYMEMSRESFYQALLKQNSDELLLKAQALARQWHERISG
jgi:hypothetical protein